MCDSISKTHGSLWVGEISTDQGIQGDLEGIAWMWYGWVETRGQAKVAQAKRNSAGVEESITKWGFYLLRDNHDRIPTHKSCDRKLHRLRQTVMWARNSLLCCHVIAWLDLFETKVQLPQINVPSLYFQCHTQVLLAKKLLFLIAAKMYILFIGMECVLS